MAEVDRMADDAAAAVLAQHGAHAHAFAAERLAFCRTTDFTEGIALWSAIIDRIAVMTAQPPARPERRDA